ncbi:MAG: GGDEF domain-containing protein [Actinophytocola sp.]|uniref:GGDEF domain-containing protein n=1 Tax=Actinophytocola sp. TaxID=1872138 RepID=UPI003C792704
MVHLLTLGSVLGSAWAFPLHAGHWTVAAILAVAGVLHLEMARGIERLRAREAGQGPYHDLKTVWNVAALLLLPPLLATVVIVATHTYGYLRIHRDDNNPHRWVYSCATVVLASQIGALILTAGVDTFPGFPSPDLTDWLIVTAATFVRWLVNYLLVIIVAGLMRPEMTFKDAFVQLSEQGSEAAATCLAIGAAMSIAFGYYPVLLGVYVIIAVLQQTSFYHRWKRERPFDPATAVYTRTAFIEIARSILDRANFRGGDQVGCLLLDLDRFKKINDTHGHHVGDQALVQLAKAIKHEIREDKDLAARWGGEEFVVLVPEVTHAQLCEVAERIRHRVSITQVVYTVTDEDTGNAATRNVEMTVSIGAAMGPNPDNATGREGLLEIINEADKLMYSAKNSGRNRVCSTLPPHPTDTSDPIQPSVQSAVAEEASRYLQ